MVSPCVRKMREQIQEELKAAIQYLAMGAHFSRDMINRPGFAKLFFEAASEERQHAMKLISYLLMRGELASSVSNLIKKHVSIIFLVVCLIIYNKIFFRSNHPLLTGKMEFLL